MLFIHKSQNQFVMSSTDQNNKIIVVGFAILFLAIGMLILQVMKQNTLLKKSNTQLSELIQVKESEIKETSESLDTLIMSRQHLEKQLENDPDFKKSFAQLRNKYPNFDNIKQELMKSKGNRRAFHQIVSEINNYSTELMHIVGKERSESLSQAKRDAIAPYKVKLQQVSDKTGNLEKELADTRTKLSEALAQIDFWKQRAGREETDKNIAQRELAVWKQKANDLQKQLAAEQGVASTYKASSENWQNKHTQVKQNLNIAVDKIDNLKLLAPTVQVLFKGKPLKDYDKNVGIQGIKRKKKLEKFLVIHHISAELQEQLFGSSTSKSVKVEIRGNSFFDSQSMNLSKTNGGQLDISHLPLGKTYYVKIGTDGSLTQNNSFEFRL